MNKAKGKYNRSGVALLVILFIVMTVTVVSLGFIARSDVELSCGINMAMKNQMDYLAQSGLEHARGIILNPQDIDTEYWTGATGLQFGNSSDYYDVSISRTGYCNYQIQSQAYRSKDSQQISSSKLQANLRLDPCIALRVGSSWTSEAGLIVNGDVYVKGNLSGTATINGDVSAKDDISTTVNISGSKNKSAAVETIPFPNLNSGNFKSTYYIGNNSYSAYQINSSIPFAGDTRPTSGNPAGICYCDGNLQINSDTNIQGTLVVKGDLTIYGANIKISAEKNFPALIVTGKLRLVSYSQLHISGLVQIKERIVGINAYGVAGASYVSFTVNGSVFINDNNIDDLSSTTNTLRINAYPDKAAIQTWNSNGTPFRWSSVGGAFYKSIERY